MSFTKRLVEDSLPIWQDCLNSEFLQRMANGSLDPECLKGYIVDDSLYLREYAKVFAWGMTKAEDMDVIRSYYSLLSFVNEGEGATRLHYLRHFGLSDGDIQRLPLRPENQAYADCMIQAARDGEGTPECMMACLPCMLSYAWIFQRLLQQAPGLKDSLFWPLVRDYASPDYEAACETWCRFTDRVCQDLSPERQQTCLEIFRACSLHELHFWEMSAKPRTDL